MIEISKTTLLDDLGTKRSLYEELGVDEYWVVDVPTAQIRAYTMNQRGSQQIDISQALPGLGFALLEEGLRQSRQVDHAQVGAWLLAQFQQA